MVAFLIRKKGLYMKNKNEKGFTLVELVIVIAVLGILIGIAIPIFTGILSNAELATDEANIHTFKSSIALYRSEQKVYPVAENYDEAVNLLISQSYLENDFPLEEDYKQIQNVDYNDNTGEVTYEGP
jgi:prepilin-type N-terminal cleavage/methylation domain-containing protein